MNYFDESQIKAIKKATSPDNKNTAIPGTAGSGKTSTIKGIVSLLRYCELMAPTGKAAARLSEVTDHEASTIHRALGYDGENWRRKNKFEYPVIVDEASMVDSALMAKILEYEPPKLILVGDDAQLEPVGKGCPFKDLINLRPDIVSRLEICHRANGAIHKASQAIRQGNAPQQFEKSDNETWRMVETGDAEKTINWLVKWIKEGYFNPKTDMILSPRYGNNDFDGGIDSINKEVKKIINPSNEEWAVGDRIIVTKNHATIGDSGIWNGDLGFITGIDSFGRIEIVLDREETNNKTATPILLNKDVMKHIKLAYALSVHKAQGSEADHVFFICLNSHTFQLNRSLIYTAVTRAKKAVIVIGQMSAFYAGINKVNHKTTILQFFGRQKEYSYV